MEYWPVPTSRDPAEKWDGKQPTGNYPYISGLIPMAQRHQPRKKICHEERITYYHYRILSL